MAASEHKRRLLGLDKQTSAAGRSVNEWFLVLERIVQERPIPPDGPTVMRFSR